LFDGDEVTSYHRASFSDNVDVGNDDDPIA